jgi:hypothetical protein
MIAAELPDWLDAEAWQAFKDMRKAKGKRAPFTEAAERRVLFELDRLRAQGYPSGQVLWQSVVAGWSSVYPLKHVQASSTVESMEVAQTKKLLADQAAHMKTENNPNKVSEAIARMAAARQAIKGKTA